MGGEQEQSHYNTLILFYSQHKKVEKHTLKVDEELNSRVRNWKEGLFAAAVDVVVDVVGEKRSAEEE